MIRVSIVPSARRAMLYYIIIILLFSEMRCLHSLMRYKMVVFAICCRKSS